MLHLNLKYAARLALLRLFGKRAMDHGMVQQGHDNFVAKVRDFFENKIDVVQQRVGSRISPNFTKDGLNTVRMRITFPTELTTTEDSAHERRWHLERISNVILKLKDCIDIFNN